MMFKMCRFRLESDDGGLFSLFVDDVEVFEIGSFEEVYAVIDRYRGDSSV